MLLWINGPFGGGKTHTTYELHRRLPGSVVSDPEHFGLGLHRMLPTDEREDYQTYPIWRRGVFEILDHLLQKHRRGPVIVPMTLVVPAYFEEIVGRLRAEGHDVRHFALLAQRETVLRRLHGRALPGLRWEKWAVQQVDRCLDALQRPEFAGASAHRPAERVRGRRGGGTFGWTAAGAGHTGAAAATSAQSPRHAQPHPFVMKDRAGRR